MVETIFEGWSLHSWQFSSRIIYLIIVITLSLTAFGSL